MSGNNFSEILSKLKQDKRVISLVFTLAIVAVLLFSVPVQAYTIVSAFTTDTSNIAKTSFWTTDTVSAHVTLTKNTGEIFHNATITLKNTETGALTNYTATCNWNYATIGSGYGYGYGRLQIDSAGTSYGHGYGYGIGYGYLSANNSNLNGSGYSSAYPIDCFANTTLSAGVYKVYAMYVNNYDVGTVPGNEFTVRTAGSTGSQGSGTPPSGTPPSTTPPTTTPPTTTPRTTPPEVTPPTTPPVTPPTGVTISAIISGPSTASVGDTITLTLLESDSPNPIANVRVEVVNLNTGRTQTLTTDENGRISVTFTQAGSYEVRLPSGTGYVLERVVTIQVTGAQAPVEVEFEIPALTVGQPATVKVLVNGVAAAPGTVVQVCVTNAAGAEECREYTVGENGALTFTPWADGNYEFTVPQYGQYTPKGTTSATAAPTTGAKPADNTWLLYVVGAIIVIAVVGAAVFYLVLGRKGGKGKRD